MTIKEPVKEPTKERSIGLTLVFESREEKERYAQFLTREGRRPAAYIMYLLEQEMRGDRRRLLKGTPAPSTAHGVHAAVSGLDGMEVRYGTDR